MGVAAAPASAETAQYTGLDRNWFNPMNWSTGTIPGRDTHVVLDGLDSVVIDPARGTTQVAIGDLHMTGLARLTTLPGTTFSTRNEHITDFALLDHHSTNAGGLDGEIVISGNAGLRINPSTQNKRTLILTSTVANVATPTVQFGLGGTAPAIPGRLGPGTYATLHAERAVLAGRLRVALHYGFQPQVGDRFQIITAGAAGGRFDNAREGEQVAAFDDVGLFITYHGGDGNDVVLTAAPRQRLLGLL